MKRRRQAPGAAASAWSVVTGASHALTARGFTPAEGRQVSATLSRGF